MATKNPIANGLWMMRMIKKIPAKFSKQNCLGLENLERVGIIPTIPESLDLQGLSGIFFC
jgi:hypothetical protein